MMSAICKTAGKNSMSYKADICTKCKKTTSEYRMSYCDSCQAGWCDKCLDNKNLGILGMYETPTGDQQLCNECFDRLDGTETKGD